MRLETDYNAFIATILLLFVVLVISKADIRKNANRIILALVAGITMPSFVPGHGEIIMLTPTAALLAVDSMKLKVIGIIFVIINSFVAWFILNKVLTTLKNYGNKIKQKS